MKTPLLSIIVPVYNNPSSSTTILNHILNQGFKDFELIVVDDGSTDSTPQELDKLANHKNVSVVTQENKGPAAARNTGLTRAKGSYIMFMDADDDFEDGMLSTMTDSIQANGDDMVVCGWKSYYTSGQSYSELAPSAEEVKGTEQQLKIYVMRSLGNNGVLYNLWNKIFRAEIIKINNLSFREDISFGEDLLFILNYFEHCKSIRIIPNALYKYHVGSTGSVFKKASLEPKYRYINAEGLNKFIGTIQNQELDDLTQWVLWRWLLSYWMIVSSSSLPYSKKIALLRLPASGQPRIASSARYVGLKKWLIERLVYAMRFSPYVSFAGSWLLSLAKSLAKQVKLVNI